MDGVVIDHCSSYLYLGSPVTSDGSVSSAVKAHAKGKMCQVLKFVSFLKKNNDIPFVVKRRVFDAALMSSLLYGCESWVGADFKPVIKLYNWSLKQLLGVRRTTANLVCYAESGYLPLPELLKMKQHKFFSKVYAERLNLNDDPLLFVINTIRTCNTPTGRLVNEYLTSAVKDSNAIMSEVHNQILLSNSSRCEVYKNINPSLSVHPVYRVKHNIKEFHRLSFTRFRVSGHNLGIETGRWNRRGRGRIPVEERLCECGSVQTEQHVMQDCPKSLHTRNAYQCHSIEDLFSGCFSDELVCKIIHEVLRLYL